MIHEMVKKGEVSVKIKGIRSLWKPRHTFTTSTSTLGILSMRGFKGEGSFSNTSGLEFSIKMPSIWKYKWEVIQNDTKIAKAQQAGFTKSSFKIELNGKKYQLTLNRNKVKSWKLQDDEDKEIFEMILGKGLTVINLIKIKDEIPLTLLVLAYFLTEKYWIEVFASTS